MGTVMKLPRRHLLHLAAGAAALPAVPRFVWAQAYPTQPVRLIVGFPAGGVADLYARLIGQWLSEHLGQPFIVENRAGAGSNLGTEAVVRASPDGYTLLQVTSANAWNATLYDNLNFNFIGGIAPVASIYRAPAVLAVHPSFPAKSVPALIAYANANPGKINMASGGVGSAQHVYGELFKMMAGVDMLHVPYRGSAPALIDLAAGNVDLMFDNLGVSLALVKGGQLKLLGVATSKRTAALPEVPTIAETLAGFESAAWFAIVAPPKTPPATVDKINADVNEALREDDIRQRLAQLSAAAGNGRLYMREEVERWHKVIKAANVKLD